jgi:PST family polysaccharide transporter
VNSTITVASFLLGLRWGAFGVAVAFSLIGTFIRFPLLFWFTTRVGPVRMSDIYTAMVVPLLAAGSVLAAIYGFRYVVVLPPLAGVAAAAMIALIVTAIVFLITPKGRTGISDLKLIIRQLISRQTQDQPC